MNEKYTEGYQWAIYKSRIILYKEGGSCLWILIFKGNLETNLRDPDGCTSKVVKDETVFFSNFHLLTD